jgi:hypothetical protein
VIALFNCENNGGRERCRGWYHNNGGKQQKNDTRHHLSLIYFLLLKIARQNRAKIFFRKTAEKEVGLVFLTTVGCA